jgi:P27 family predicted phage terminase small subunit
VRGRKPKPTARQIAEGDPRKKGKRKLEEKLAAEPNTTRGLPACPRHLKGRARAAWTFWVAELADMGLDRRPDAMMLEGACVNYSRAVQADLIVERDGPMVEESMIDEKSGERIVLKIKYHPAITVSNAAWRQVRAFCSEFGLSPVSRTRLTIEKKDDGLEDLAKILSQPRAPRQNPTTVQ